MRVHLKSALCLSGAHIFLLDQNTLNAGEPTVDSWRDFVILLQGIYFSRPFPDCLYLPAPAPKFPFMKIFRNTVYKGDASSRLHISSSETKFVLLSQVTVLLHAHFPSCKKLWHFCSVLQIFISVSVSAHTERVVLCLALSSVVTQALMHAACLWQSAELNQVTSLHAGVFPTISEAYEFYHVEKSLMISCHDLDFHIIEVVLYLLLLGSQKYQN